MSIKSGFTTSFEPRRLCGIIIPAAQGLRFYSVFRSGRVDRACRVGYCSAQSAAPRAPSSFKSNTMNTYSAKPAEVEKKWVLIDAERPRRRPPCLDHRHAPPRQAPAGLHPACRLRRQRRRHQCRQGRPHRPEARRQDLLLAHRLDRRHQGAHGAPDPRGQVPRARRSRRPSSA